MWIMEKELKQKISPEAELCIKNNEFVQRVDKDRLIGHNASISRHFIENFIVLNVQERPWTKPIALRLMRIIIKLLFFRLA